MHSILRASGSVESELNCTHWHSTVALRWLVRHRRNSVGGNHPCRATQFLSVQFASAPLCAADSCSPRVELERAKTEWREAG